MEMAKKRSQGEVFDFRREIRRSRHRRWLSSLKLMAGGLGGGILIGVAVIYWATPSDIFSTSKPPSSQQFPVCGLAARSCVIDGDTFWLEGVKIRIADIDTPELKGRCDWEIQKAEEARDRLVLLLNEGPFDIQPIGDRDEDQYGRKLRVLTRGGNSIGDQLVSEGLARTWTGRREPWC